MRLASFLIDTSTGDSIGAFKRGLEQSQMLITDLFLFTFINALLPLLLCEGGEFYVVLKMDGRNAQWRTAVKIKINFV